MKENQFNHVKFLVIIFLLGLYYIIAASIMDKYYPINFSEAGDGLSYCINNIKYLISIIIVAIPSLVYIIKNIRNIKKFSFFFYPLVTISIFYTIAFLFSTFGDVGILSLIFIIPIALISTIISFIMGLIKSANQEIDKSIAKKENNNNISINNDEINKVKIIILSIILSIGFLYGTYITKEYLAYTILLKGFIKGLSLIVLIFYIMHAIIRINHSKRYNWFYYPLIVFTSFCIISPLYYNLNLKIIVYSTFFIAIIISIIFGIKK